MHKTSLSVGSFAFFGTPDVARDTLSELFEFGIVPTVVITNPPAKSGRGMILTKTPVDLFAKEKNIPLLTPKILDEKNIREIQSYNCDFAIVVAYGKIFPETLIKTFQRGVVNVHYSLLPKYRGAAPVETALAHGEITTGVSLQYMQRELDAGDIIATIPVKIELIDTAQTLFKKLIPAGTKLLRDSIQAIASGAVVAIAQDAAKATYAPKIKKEAGLITMQWGALALWNQYRAYGKRPGTYFYAIRNEKRIRAKVCNATYENDSFFIQRIVPEGKKEQSYEEFLRAGWRAESL